MSKCCKCAKWLPHNWLCLKGLSIVFLVLFYLTLCFTVAQIATIFIQAPIIDRQIWLMVVYYLCSDLLAAVAFLTVAKVLKVLRKIKEAVAPCNCSTDAEAK